MIAFGFALRALLIAVCSVAIEPEVYDVLLPGTGSGGADESLRIAFDPEALPEHPGAQLASFGVPKTEIAIIG